MFIARPLTLARPVARPAALLRRLPLVGLMLLSACGGGGGGDGGGGGAGDRGAAAPAGPDPGTAVGVPRSAALGSVHQGDGTYYDATGVGACTLAPAADHLTAAMNAPDYAQAAVCGQYVEVTGPRGTVTLRISDLCPECAAGDLDLSAEAFARIADPVAGRVRVSWQVVAGPVSGPLQYRYKEGSSIYWTAIQVRNSRLPISRLQIQPGGSTTWIDVPRTDYNYFVHVQTVADAALRVRVTASTGAQLEDVIPAPRAGLQVDGAAQFP
jgi:expansin (peptidoglycan-binding protein)